MSQTSRTRSIDSTLDSLQHAMDDVQDTVSSSVRPTSIGALPRMSQYRETRAPNTVFAQCGGRSLTRSTSSGHRRRSISPIGISIAQKRAELATNMAANAASGIGQVTASVDATHNIVETVLEMAIATQGSIEETIRAHIQQSLTETSQTVDDIVHRLATEITTAASGFVMASETPTREIMQGLHNELQTLEYRLVELGTGIEQLQKRISENQLVNDNVLHRVERCSQQQFHDQAVESQNAVNLLSQRVEAQSKSVRHLPLQLGELNQNFGSIQADVMRWRVNEQQSIDEEFMETETPETGNPVPVVSTTEFPPYKK